MPSPIEAFPTEIFQNFSSYLNNDDIARLMRVSKPYHAFFAPILWTKIEWHSPEFHIRQAHAALRQEEYTGFRDLAYTRSHVLSEKHDYHRSTLFLQTLSLEPKFGKGLPHARITQLGSSITFLCLTISPRPHAVEEPYDIWNPFTNLPNLTYLELSAFWVPRTLCVPFTPPPPSADAQLKHLRTLKLRGYVDVSFVQWLLQPPSPPRLQELQLGILDFPINTPFASNNIDCNIPNDLPAHDRARYKAAGPVVRGGVAARGVPCLTPSILHSLANINLKKLHLIKPSSGIHIDYVDYFHPTIFFSDESDMVVLEEWKDLLTATRDTLEHVVLDARPVAGAEEAESENNYGWVLLSTGGPSYEAFLNIVLPLLESSSPPKPNPPTDKQQNSKFLSLKSLTLFGFEPHKRPDQPDDAAYNHTLLTDARCRTVDMPSRLRRALGGTVEVLNYDGRRVLMCEDRQGCTKGVGCVFESPKCHDSPPPSPTSSSSFDVDAYHQEWNDVMSYEIPTPPSHHDGEDEQEEDSSSTYLEDVGGLFDE